MTSPTPKPFDELLTIDELDANTHELKSDPRIATTVVGASRSGRPIEMISVGEGDRDALIVGVPHANEPVGAVTVERMIELFRRDPGAQHRRGYRWHFIKAIDPDGLRLNEGWLKGPRTLRNYFAHFFRPALHRQPEMTFPLDGPDVQFTASTPENLAWQNAFAITRPSLHASLHHCDYAGAYFCVSRALPGVGPRLEQLIRDAGLPANEEDDGLVTVDRVSPSVTVYPSAATLMKRAALAGIAWASPWTWGEMSPGFGETRYGAFTILAEVPLWDDPRLRNSGPSALSLGDHVVELHRIRAATGATVSRHVEALATAVETPDGEELVSALRESVRFMPDVAGAGDKLEPGERVRILSMREYCVRHVQHALFAIRPYGLLIRLAHILLKTDPHNAAARSALAEGRENLDKELMLIEGHAPLTPVALSTLSSVQMNAIFACAEELKKTVNSTSGK